MHDDNTMHDDNYAEVMGAVPNVHNGATNSITRNR